ELAVVAYGSSRWAVEEARERLLADGVKTSSLRIQAYPFTAEVEAFLARHERIYVVEQNRDGQMAALLRMEYPERAARLRSVLHYDGLPLAASTVVEKIRSGEREEVEVR
ncbi:MAG TPA: 2-oxoacid:acceptor oxidoreductase subunit alpha, partial [Candidatus Eisenbacteria bacterium]|nr:2-oxoacid:acceptor oxidoreductase subunit alpha [Candidatus Eisenbacteria bacterium]